MALACKLVYGATEVSLVTTTAIYASMGGVGARRIGEIPGGPDEWRLTETFKLNVRGSSHDNAATQARSVRAILLAAWQYNNTNWQTTPVYLQEQTSGETSARYALVYGSPEIEFDGLFSYVFNRFSFLPDTSLSITRGVWRASAPGTLPTALTQTATDGPASPTKVILANFLDDVAVTHLYNYDSSVTTYSANQIAENGITLFSVAAAAPADEDQVVIGSTTAPWHHFVLQIATAADYVATFAIEYAKGGGAPTWTALTAGSQYTIFAENGGDLTTIFKTTGMWSINVQPPSDWAVATINGVSAYWIRIRIDTFTSTTTTALSHGTVDCYTQKKPYLELSATAVKGDMEPFSLLRLWHPAGSTTTPGMGTTSRILFGAKSVNLDAFDAFLNLGNAGLPSGWAVTYGTDSSAVANVAAPRGLHCAVSFATDTTMVVRATATGTAKLAKWRGEYRVILRAYQVGGAVGDTQVKLRVMIGATTSGNPLYETSAAVPLKTMDAGWELVDLGLLKLPLVDTMSADTLTNDLILQVFCERVTGAAVLRLADLILLPIDESSGALNDPVSDIITGASTLRGNCVLDLDGGILANRTVKYIRSGSTLYPAETWERDGRALMLNPLRQTRVYFLMCRYPTTFGTGPLLSDLGMQLAAEVFDQPIYEALRGND